MAHFDSTPRASIPRSVFDRSHGHKTTFDSGYLVPVLVDEVLPGDTYNVKASIFARLATPIVPIMDNLYIDFFSFFVPNRLLWANWTKFMGEENNPDDVTDYVMPVIQTAGWAGPTPGTIWDYFGLPIGQGSPFPVAKVCSLPFRAYNLIWNEWFRDQNLQDREPFTTADGPDQASWYKLLRRGKRPDYFTTCLPWPQKGPGVMIPIGGLSVAPNGSNAGPTFRTTTGGSYPLGTSQMETDPGNAAYAVSFPEGDDQVPLLWGQTGLMVDMDDTTAGTINSLRTAFQIQKLLERDARGGTRYIELLKAHFGVTNPDFRLQRPEFLGGGEIAININPVAQTSGTPNEPATGYTMTPQANLAAYGTAGGNGIGFTKSFTEHGFIIVLAAVRADLSYQQGLHRMWTRQTRFDFFWPAFANLGEQAVLKKELHYSDAPTNNKNDTVFGYQERWAEYRYGLSKITGLFRSGHSTSIDIWHLAQDFGPSTADAPELNAAFIEDVPPVDRVVAVTDEPQILFDSWWNMKCTRPMPSYSIPGLVDHF